MVTNDDNRRRIIVLSEIEAMAKSERDRIQVDLTGTDLREQIERLMESDPIYRGRSMVAVIRMLLEQALSGESQPVEAEVTFLHRLEQRQWLSEAEIVDVAAELEVEPSLLIELQSCVKGGKKSANGNRSR